MSCIAVVALLLGCTSAPQSKSVTVGMPFRQAESVMKSAGARQVQMDMMDETEADITRSYDLADGRALVVVVSKSDDKVSKLEICKNADQPKSRRTWTSVRSVELTKD
jgi:hypothetical protein